jgi:hypothetical protein
MNRIDIIGIGAVNYDFIFDFRVGTDETLPLTTESGREDLGDAEQCAVVEEHILRRIARSSDFIAEVGGSAYRTIKTISAIEMGLSTAYVGVYSLPQNVERKAGLNVNPKQEFGHLANTEWLFQDKSAPPGRALVKLRHGLRHSIEVAPGCNSTLKDRILLQEAERRKSNDKTTLDDRPHPFTEFIASARWIHLSSLSDFEQFQFFVERVRDAKEINTDLRFSIDPGDEYTRKYGNRLSDAFAVADYIFLSQKEFDNITGGGDFPWRNRVDAVAELTEGGLSFSTQVLIVKSPNKHVLLSYIESGPLRRTFRHPRLWWPQIRNDTGAGDVFAGGVIAALLSPFMLTHQPAPIRLGATLSAYRMKAGRCLEAGLRTVAWKFLESNQHKERDNLGQRMQLLWEKNWPWLLSIAISFGTGALVTWLFTS